MNTKVLKLGSQIVVHVIGVSLLTMLIAFSILPNTHFEFLSDTFQRNEALLTSSTSAFLIHVGLAACLWAMIYIVFSLAKLHRDQRKTVAIKRATGSVMTETLVILPLFFLLAFGMGQLAINNVGGILANVAAYEAGRSAWVWQPEEAASNKRMGVTDGIAKSKAEIAVALVMMPIAPGEFVSDQDIGTMGGKMRCAALLSHFPFLGNTTCDLAGTAADLTTTLDQITGGNRATEENTSYFRALDTVSFLQRTYTKFTHAVHAANVTINDDASMTMEYDHLIAMPLVGRVFGSMKTVGGRQGYYTTYTRNYGLREQINTPNAFLPNNDIAATPQPPEPSQGDLQDDLE